MKQEYNEILIYLKKRFEEYDSAGGARKYKIKYSRYDHTMRVYKWMLELYEAYPDKEKVDFESLAIATLFHDVGYSAKNFDGPHAKASAQYCREYLQENNYDAEKTDFICDLIARHSDKETLFDEIPAELVLLMEADLLDDTGVQALVMDTWMEAVCEEVVNFESILAHMERYTVKEMKNNPMRTEKGKAIWEEKQKLTEQMVEAYREDLRFGI